MRYMLRIEREWGRYYNKNDGLGIVLMNYGILITEWKDTIETRPNFMRQTAFVPCNCGKCSLNGLTSGIVH